MTWTPIGGEELAKVIANAVAAMEPSARLLWSLIRVRPVRWSLSKWGELGGGFWVVGLLGEHVVWFNDIEWGFNVSRYEDYGVISEYWCNQDELQHTIYFLLHRSNDNELPERFGPPESLDADA